MRKSVALASLSALILSACSPALQDAPVGASVAPQTSGAPGSTLPPR